ncbi:MAG: phosphomethylpyrimidine synthase ThiC [Leptolyngbya sp. PLA3]|nr:MAG: phosphomethylpyrimidine synthase ThiC [Cyanobacteria bacterium CYA]MCE7968457.1 phosphomethylpyrimidine synthase ThiC [Leptolyngbya sp. PL-A3]
MTKGTGDPQTKCGCDHHACVDSHAAPPLRHSVSPSLEAVEFTDARCLTRRVTFPAGFRPVTQLEHARLGIITPEMRRVAQREPHLTPEQVRDEIAAGRLIIPANIHHLAHQLDPMAIGRATKTKVNANMGASPVSSSTDEEVEKLRWAERWGSDTCMDLSTGGDLDACREAIIANARVPIGTVPIYSMIIGRKLEDLTPEIILETIEHQARQGVDYMTIHAGVVRKHLPLVKNRLIGIVSRGGSLLAKWMLTHNAENPMYTLWDDICRILRRHDVSFSIGDGLRPGGLADASDQAQLAELAVIGELTERAWRHGVQVMVEGPGHVPFDQIEYNAKLQRAICHGAPFYVLGPLVTDVFPGYDHITSCIGATAIAYHGAAMLCYVTPKEHLGLPKRGDVKEGCIAYKIAAHAADVALGIPGTRDWDDELTKARAALNWQKHFELAYDEDTARAYHDEDLDVDTDFCAMCGHDWCSVRISKEIQEFASGKAKGFERGKAVRSGALTAEQRAILEQRGYLKPEEIHKLAEKARGRDGETKGRGDEVERTRSAGGGVEAKPSCHSDYVDSDEAKRLQREALGGELIQLDTSEAHNLAKEDRLI